MSEYAIDWEICILCDEHVSASDDLAEGSWMDQQGRRRRCHRECALRNVIGGIGHLTDHAYWCGQMNDPDGGQTYRESAKAVDSWVRQNGLEGVGD